jgi:hypothetical protein
MGEATREIEAHIAETRTDLGSNLQELEQKILLATILGGGKRSGRERRFSNPTSSEPHGGTDHQKHKALETWDNIRGALIGVAAMRFKDFVGEVVFGFHEQFQRTEEKAKTIRPETYSKARHREARKC